MAGKIVNACAVLHNMRIHYRLTDIENIDYSDNTNYYNDFHQNEIVERGGPRAIAMRIQKQIMQDWFPNYIDGDT